MSGHTGREEGAFFGKTGTQTGGGQGTYTDCSAWNILYVMSG